MKKIAREGDIYIHTYIHRHRDLLTNSAQRAELVKITINIEMTHTTRVHVSWSDCKSNCFVFQTEESMSRKAAVVNLILLKHVIPTPLTALKPAPDHNTSGAGKCSKLNTVRYVTV